MLCTFFRDEIFKAISCFNLEDHSLGMLPNYAKTELRYPEGFKPENADDPNPPTPESLYDFVPGHAAVGLLAGLDWTHGHDGLRRGCQLVLTRFLERELAALPRGVYYLSQAMKNRGEEPENYNSLKETSVLRAFVNFLLVSEQIISILDRKHPEMGGRHFLNSLCSIVQKKYLS